MVKNIEDCFQLYQALWDKGLLLVTVTMLTAYDRTTEAALRLFAFSSFVMTFHSVKLVAIFAYIQTILCHPK